MSQDLGQLLLKALSGLPREEQGDLLVQLLGRSTPVPWTNPLIDVGLGGQIDGSVRRSTQATLSETELKVLPVRLPAADYERLRDWSKSHDFSMAVIVRTLVERFLDAQEAKSPPSPPMD